jgi:hypothetical protein
MRNMMEEEERALQNFLYSASWSHR